MKWCYITLETVAKLSPPFIEWKYMRVCVCVCYRAPQSHLSENFVSCCQFWISSFFFKWTFFKSRAGVVKYVCFAQIFDAMKHLEIESKTYIIEKARIFFFFIIHIGFTRRALFICALCPQIRCFAIAIEGPQEFEVSSLPRKRLPKPIVTFKTFYPVISMNYVAKLQHMKS